MIPSLIFWISLGLILYVHCGYPLLLRALAALRAPPAYLRSDLPGVSILLVALTIVTVLVAPVNL